MKYVTATIKYIGIFLLVMTLSLALVFYFVPRDSNPADAAWAVGIWSGVIGVVLGRLAGRKR